MIENEYGLPRSSGYQIVRRLGSGGEGTVFLVCHLSTEQLRAAKVLKNIHEDQKHELDMMKHLHHPYLPKMIDVLEEEGYLWLIMEYIQGCQLEQLVSQGISNEQLWLMASQLSQALVYLHSRKEPIFHLDIKPSNVLIRPDQTIVLIDFGASIRGHPLEENKGKYGTRGFAASEQQQRGMVVDARTDIYGAGALLHYCCYGHIPVKEQNSVIFAEQRLKHWWLVPVIKKCLEEDPGKRFQDSRQLYHAICKAWKKECFCRKMAKTAGAMMLLLLVTVLLISSLFDFSQNTLEVTAELATENAGENILEGITERQEEAETETRVQEYDRLLSMAGGMGFLQAVECYKQASELYPGDSEWFLQLLAQVTGDGVFELEEEDAVKELIYAISSDQGDTALELLASDTNGYGLVTYRMGLAYWYYYEGAGGKSAAVWWFQLASASGGEESDSDWLESAIILSRIGSYYGMLGSTSAEEEREAKEWDYWNDLKKLWYLYQEQGEQMEIRAQTAEEILSLIVLKSAMLREYGASLEETEEILSAIESFLDGEEMVDSQKKREKLEEQSLAARSALDRAYQE